MSRCWILCGFSQSVRTLSANRSAAVSHRGEEAHKGFICGEVHHAKINVTSHGKNILLGRAWEKK